MSMSIDGDDDDWLAGGDECPKCEAQEVNRVLSWLKKNNVDDEIRQVLSKLTVQEPSSQVPESPVDPWRSLQSTKDRLCNVSAQVDSAISKTNELQDQLRVAEEAKDALIDKR